MERLKPIAIGDVIDGAALRGALSAAHADRGEVGRDAVKALLLEALSSGRATARERLEAGENGLAVARLLTAVADEVVGALYDYTTTHVFRARNPTEGERFAVLSDILGDEDHLGDMDFKVAGTRDGITSLQMDIKITGITEEIMRVALFQAKDGRMHILGKMAEALTESRPGLGEYAPRIEVMTIPVDKIREVIGSGGRVIRE